MDRNGGVESAEVLINGERLAFSDEVAFLIADDVIRGNPGDFSSDAQDHRPADSTERREEERRFGPMTRVCERLDALTDPDRRVAWLVAPNARLGGIRPIDALSEGRLDEVLGLIETLSAHDFDGMPAA